jgi:hypothetical protein
MPIPGHTIRSMQTIKSISRVILLLRSFNPYYVLFKALVGGGFARRFKAGTFDLKSDFDLLRRKISNYLTRATCSVPSLHASVETHSTSSQVTFAAACCLLRCIFPRLGLYSRWTLVTYLHLFAGSFGHARQTNSFNVIIYVSVSVESTSSAVGV